MINCYDEESRLLTNNERSLMSRMYKTIYVHMTLVIIIKIDGIQITLADTESPSLGYLPDGDSMGII